MGESMKSYSTIRWWSRFDLMERLPALGPAHHGARGARHRGIGDATTPHLREIYDALPPTPAPALTLTLTL